jgi:DNA-directed RNA polymerase specialized sigma24 family protein
LKIPNNIDLDRYQWENEIERWIFNEQHRKMLKLNLLDGWTYERIAEEFDMSSRQIARIIPKLQEQLFKHIS